MESTLDDRETIHIRISDTRDLEAAVMPFIRNGGLFVDQSNLSAMRYHLGTELAVNLDIQPAGERLSIVGRVIWVTPARTERRAGIGVQFSEADGPDLRRRIHNICNQARS